MSRRFAVPAGSVLRRVFVNGRELRAGRDFTVDGAAVALATPVRPRAEVTPLRNAIAAVLWISVEPDGDEVVAELELDGAIRVVDLRPEP
jgi:hypothetical protein